MMKVVEGVFEELLYGKSNENGDLSFERSRDAPAFCLAECNRKFRLALGEIVTMSHI
jgi:hypothetical protein